MTAPKLTIRIHDGLTVFTSVTIDGHDYPVTRVAFDTGLSENGIVLVNLTLHADIDIEIDGERPGLVMGPQTRDRKAAVS